MAISEVCLEIFPMNSSTLSAFPFFAIARRNSDGGMTIFAAITWMQQDTCLGFTLYRDDDNNTTVYRFQIADHDVQLPNLLSVTKLARSITLQVTLQVMRTFVGVEFILSGLR